ncbi:hypothetical protein O181_090268 [Austropuccinia psidii MF-1]|uniref:Abscisic acid G-protein coupled receptor-like domain-containing protein n=1 Tax=Austropuccinia psidii MF-1 TaxID=1389203 RepID=A0A9Q3IUR9_9BASI|nr:hypothetical protein [Austropuccinia psidii MF-1]
MASSLISHLSLISLRITFFIGCKRYLHQSLLNDLKKVIKEDLNQINSNIAIDQNHPSNQNQNHPSNQNQVHQNNSLNSSNSSVSISKDNNLLNLNQSLKKNSLKNWFQSNKLNQIKRSIKSNNLSSHHQKISTTISTFLFCWNFCEGSLLFSIVIFGSWLDPLARNLNWNLSLALLISSVVFIVPFLECLLLSTSILNKKSTTTTVRLLSTRTLCLTFLPFGIYLFVYYRVGQTMQGLLGVESGNHSFGLLNTTLARICVPGVFLIASLSGGGAVNTAWQTWQLRFQNKESPITDQHIVTAEQSLLRTQKDLSERKLTLEQQEYQQQGTNVGSKADGSGLIATLFTGSSSSKLNQLQQEIAGLQAMEAQMIHDINELKERKEYHEYSRTIPGMLLNIANWGLSVYCVYRLFMACVNLIFGYVRRPPTDLSGNVSRNPTTDVVTYLIAKILSTFNVELELAKLTRLVGLVLIGSIIVVNLRAVLVWLHRGFNRVSSSGVSSSLMLLVLGQLMAMYLLTSLISLPSSSSPSSSPTDEIKNVTSELLNTLPSFSRFSRLFDIVFLLTGILTGLIRWLNKQINGGNEEMIALSRIGGGYV